MLVNTWGTFFGDIYFPEAANGWRLTEKNLMIRILACRSQLPTLSHHCRWALIVAESRSATTGNNPLSELTMSNEFENDTPKTASERICLESVDGDSDSPYT